MDSPSYSAIMAHLHKVMKKQKISFSRLSTVIGKPESTLKKWFGAEDGALSRIQLVCSALGITLGEILQRIDQEQLKTIVMGAKQQAHFLQDMRSFEIYWLLVYERFSLPEVRDALKLSESDLRRHLLKLDRLKLIEFNIKEKTIVPKVIPVRWACQGPFLQKLFRDWSQKMLEQSLASGTPGNFILQYFQLSPESEKELHHDLTKLEEKFARKTISYISQAGENIKGIRFLMASAEGSFLPR